MKFKRNKVATALACLLGAGGVVSLPTAFAQAVNPDVPSSTRPPAPDIRVEVTGSNIKRLEGEGALPVQVITRQEIEQQGIQTAMGVVERLSSNSSIGGLNLQGSEGATGVGYAAASLRGLGSARTLVLLNGRRLANTAFSGTSVDINSIPLSAIERVEVLTDGASAIYGTDAIGGVINFILRKDFTGVEASAYYGDSDQGGGATQRYNVTAGWGDLSRDKFNVFGTVDYNKIDPIAARQRSFSKSAFIPGAPGGDFDKTSGNSIPGNVSIPGVGTRNPANPACLPPFSFPTVGNSALQCRFDYASVIDIVPPSESWNVFGAARWQFHPDHQAFLEASWSRTESTSKVSPSPISSATLLSGEPVLAVPSSPFYPHAFAAQYGVDGQPLAVSWRGLELGPRTDFNTIEQSRVVGGVQGVIGGWDYTAAINWSDSKAWDEWKAGWLRGSVLLPILNSGQINLFGFNTPEAVDLMRQALVLGTVQENKSSMTEVTLNASRDIYKLPAGPLSLALGAQYRHETLQQTSAEAINSGDVPGFGGSVPSLAEVKRNVYAFSAELNVPITKTLEGNVAVRYDDYQDVGSTTNPKVSLRWQPSQQVLVRGAWGTGFRAPSLIELFIPNSFSSTGGTYNDPLRCPTTGSPRDCDTQFTTRLGGNPNLKPERSTNWTAGLVLEPIPAVTMSADYYYIKVKDIIGVAPEGPIFNDIPAAEAAGILVRYPVDSTGCPPSERVGGIPCPVQYSIQNNLNVNQITTSGIDLNGSFRFPRFDWGQFKFDINGTYVFKWDQNDGTGTQHLVGTYAGSTASVVQGPGATGAFPRWKHNINLGWTFGPWNANLNQLYVNGYSEPADDTPTRRVGSYSIWGINGSYTGFKNLTLTIGIKNLWNTDPPFTRQDRAFQIGYDPFLTDPTGRFYYGSIRYAFK
jgi:iron complex outermembrane receptor protein